MNKLILITLLTLSTITFNANATVLPEEIKETTFNTDKPLSQEQTKEIYVAAVNWIIKGLGSATIDRKIAKEVLEDIKRNSQSISISLIRRINGIIRYYNL